MDTQIKFYDECDGRAPQPMVYTYSIDDRLTVRFVAYYKSKSNSIGADVLECYNVLIPNHSTIELENIPFLKESREKAIEFFKSRI